MTFQTNFKPSRTARKKAEKKVKGERITKEVNAKKEVRIRDGYRCRFPLCGCQKLGLPKECVHRRHKGMGGNPTGDRSTPAGMIYVCNHRHQFGAVSFHKGTLEAIPLDESTGYNGPVRWEVDTAEGWVEVARETSVQHIEPLTAKQSNILQLLAEMDL